MVKYTYRGLVGEIIPRDAKVIIASLSCEFVQPRAFQQHPEIEQVIMTKNVKRIGRSAFANCPKLLKVCLCRVTIIDECAFFACEAVREVVANHVTHIKYAGFGWNEKLRRINLPSLIVAGDSSFMGCEMLFEVQFGSPLQKLKKQAFAYCLSLKYVTIPLKLDLLDNLNVFENVQLETVNLVKGSEIMNVISALQCKRWKADMLTTIDSIDIFLRAAFGYYRLYRYGVVEKPRLPYTHYGDCVTVVHSPSRCEASGFCIDRWSRLLIRKITHYQDFHSDVIEMAGSVLMQYLSREIVFESILPYLSIPSHSLPDLL